MQKKSTYRLLVQSEDKSRNILEIALYGLFAISAAASIWQFAQQTSSFPLHRVERATELRAETQMPS